jgi:predicted dehydrogenase
MERNADMTRRAFIKAGSIAAGAAVIGAHSRARAAGANGRLNLAVIGCGGMAGHHLEKLLAMQDDANIAVAAVCDVYGKRAREFALKVSQAGGSARVFDDYRRVLDLDDIDSVLIATPEHSHAYVTLDALDAGKHVYCEKPLTHTIPEALAVVRKVDETGLKLQVGVQGMADDSYRSACEAIRAGKLGKVVQAQIDYVRNYGDAGPWRTGVEDGAPQPADLDWETWVKPAAPRPWNPHHYFEWRCYRDYSGGVATDLFVHRVTRLIAACGLAFPERVTGMGGIYTWPDGRDLPDSFELLAQYPAVEGASNGLTLHVLGTMANDHGNTHCIRGTKATLEFTRTGWEIKDGESGEVTEKHRKTGGENVDPHHRNHHAAIREGADLNCPAVLGLYGVAVVRMANLSWFDGKTYAWDAGAMEARPA